RGCVHRAHGVPHGWVVTSLFRPRHEAPGRLPTGNSRDMLAGASVMTATTFGKYELVSKLASGGMAVTYKALMLGAMGVKKPVVLKLIHPHLAEEAEFVDMFIEEAKLSATLTHSNIAQVFDFGEVDGRYFIAMELVD